LYYINKNGGTLFPKSSSAFQEGVPRFLIASRRMMFRILNKNKIETKTIKTKSKQKPLKNKIEAKNH